MTQEFDIIKDYLSKYYMGNEKFVIIAFFCLLYLLIFEKSIRKKYALPLLIYIFVVINPILYKYVYSRTYMYWRLFWVFSLHIIIGITVVSLIKRIKNDLAKMLGFAMACLLIVYLGNGIVFSNNTLSEYTDVVNIEKLPYEVPIICEKMLELEDEPKCINDLMFSVYARVYSGKIKQLWGRNASNFISILEGEAKEIYEASNVYGDMYYVLSYAAENGYNFVLTETENRTIIPSIVEMCGFELVLELGDDYHLYHYVGTENTSID